MTPLLHRITKELTLPLTKRTFEDNCGLLGELGGVHSFEVTEVWSIAVDLAENATKCATSMGHFDLMEVQTFLPAPRTWIERIDEQGTREAFLLVQEASQATATVYLAAGDKNEFFSLGSTGGLWLEPSTTDLRHPDWKTVLPTEADKDVPFAAWGMTFIVYSLLAIINTPRLIGRKQHMPHRALERALTRGLGVGRFPLGAWTELKLSTSAHLRDAGSEENEAHLTGRKCLHFCRAHLRVRNGRLEMVKSHWRGDPALGIKRTRYKVTA